MDEFVVHLTPREAAFVHQVGRYLRKQEGWWDDDPWESELRAVAAKFEALPWRLPACASPPQEQSDG